MSKSPMLLAFRAQQLGKFLATPVTTAEEVVKIRHESAPPPANQFE